MEGRGRAENISLAPPLHTFQPYRRTALNRLFAAVYACAIIALFYRHTQTHFYSKTTLSSFFLTFYLLLSDLVLAFMWMTAQAFRMCPIRRKELPENLKPIMKGKDLPGLDVFVCTADPYKEPPMNVVNTALSLMAFDYPTEKISVYVSDDGGSVLTLFAFMEAAKFARQWLPFCKEKHIMERSPEVYFASDFHSWGPEIQRIKIMYENMKAKVAQVLTKGEISGEYIIDEEYRQAFNKWTHDFIYTDHPTVIQVILDRSKDRDVSGKFLPNLIYVSREKRKTSPHHFKAGALNVMLRVSGIMTNAPIVLTQDCDMFSNDPQTPLRALCYMLDPNIKSKLAYVQFPQLFHTLNKNDIYACEYKRLFQINPQGFDGLNGPNYVGSGCFFRRRAFFGGPSNLVSPEISELSPGHLVDKPINSRGVLSLAQQVAGCNYENQTRWGSKIGFRYGSLVEDFYTGYRLKCEGWKGIFCNPERAAFLGDAPITLLDLLSQCKRWNIGNLQVAFCKYDPLIFGSRSMGLLMGLGYSYYAFCPFWFIPITFYCFLPQLALLNKVSISPKISERWFWLYIFLFLGAYAQDFLNFVLAGSTVRRWWNAQRMWMIKGLSCFLFASVDFLLSSFGISTQYFSLTNKVVDDEQCKRYDEGIFEFGVPSPMFVPLTMAAIINLVSFLKGLTLILGGNNNREGLCLQMLLTGLIVLNCRPVYGAIALSNDKGKMPTQITLIAALLSMALCTTSYFILQQ